jgi:hypothetical protein
MHSREDNGQPSADGPIDDLDGDLLAAVRAEYEDTDPAPDMVARVLFALDIDDMDAEFATIAERFVVATGARGAEATSTITFTGTGLTVTVMVPLTGDRHLDGWLEPPVSLRIDFVTPDRRLETWSDEGGRFAFDDVPAGAGHLEIHPSPGPPERMTRRVVTQQFEI